MFSLRDYLYIDKLLLALWLTLVGIGLFTVCSAVSEGYPEFIKDSVTNGHVFQTILAVVLFSIVVINPLKFVRLISQYALFFALFIAVLLTFFGTHINGEIPFFKLTLFGDTQVSIYGIGIVVIACVFYFSHLFEAEFSAFKPSTLAKFSHVFLFALLVVLCFLLTASSVVTLFIIALMFAYLKGESYTSMSLRFASIAVFTLLIVLANEYRLRRLLTFLDPWDDPFGAGYQLLISLMAIGRGGWTGQGVGESAFKQGLLPEGYGNFIIAIIAEEVGVLGVIVLLSLILMLVLRVFRIGKQLYSAGNYFGAGFSWLTGMLITVNTFWHCASVSGLIPTIGKALPWISYGSNNVVLYTMLLAVVIRCDIERKLSER